MGSTVLVTNDSIYGFGSNSDSIFGQGVFATSKPVKLSQKPVDDAVVSFSFHSRKFYTLSLQNNQLSQNFDEDVLILDENESIIQIYSALGLDLVQTNQNLYFRGACDEAFCSVSEQGEIYSWYVEEWTKMLLPFSASDIKQVKLQQQGVLFLLHNHSVFAMGSNIYGRFCVEYNVHMTLHVPTHILNDVQHIALGQYTTFFSVQNELYQCGSPTLQTLENDWFDGSEAKFVKRFKQIEQIEAAAQAVFVIDQGKIFIKGVQDEESYVGDEDGYEDWEEPYIEGKIHGIYAGNGGTVMWGEGERIKE
ncbi:Regulator_of chromosome condensation 1/beta-lactamase-inhibitor protein II [Hexamita inflata]|uniref:Regulator of chromosome condensation 1/beta-lactamase-inhibitor protein II n=1 Tax=Hexamita inflata TaxID=28002 RepID=A0AA86R840_9EUKA|nr:Regulator of chromosome condensation 1/beta-lactamase-inhibitor protein II [Hexamita inflata]